MDEQAERNLTEKVKQIKPRFLTWQLMTMGLFSVVFGLISFVFFYVRISKQMSWFCLFLMPLGSWLYISARNDIISGRVNTSRKDDLDE